MKKRFIVGRFVLFIGLMTLLTGCQDKRNSREWLENRFGTELSRLYPTKNNLEDLFKEFPDGFKIEQNYWKKEDVIEIAVKGNSENNIIMGTLTHSKGNKVLDIIKIEYRENKFVFSDKVKAKQLWPYNGFLFQHLTVNKHFLSQQTMINKEYLSENGDFNIQYKLDAPIISNYLHLKNYENYNLDLGGSNSNTGYYYSVGVEDNKNVNNFNFSEIISDTKN
ncbi:hypothetical protein [Streptococcus mutans]|uniref:hypothetical protein n=1 Tax=Streptococcus mutans TaxID=1309 RepID=UPI0020B17107|nr:hypothetical protein [Streptococcus mutans]